MDAFRPADLDSPQVRVGDTERDHVVGRLHDHFAQGRLTTAELDERLDAALRAKTAGELSTVMSDLPEPQQARQRSVRDQPPSWQLPYGSGSFGHGPFGHGPFGHGAVRHGGFHGSHGPPWRMAGGRGMPGFVPLAPVLLVVLLIAAGQTLFFVLPFILMLLVFKGVFGRRYRRPHKPSTASKSQWAR